MSVPVEFSHARVQAGCGPCEGTVKSLRPWIALLAALGLGAGIGALTAGGDGGEADALAAQVTALRSRAVRLEDERDRLRQERNQLEARLAAGEAPPVCPQEYVSTGSLLPYYTVDYPCGWHAVYDPRITVASAEDREGLQVEVLLLSRLPVSLAPRGGPAADVELADWTDDPADAEDNLPPIEQWVAEERDRYDELSRDDRFEAGEGATVYRLAGTQPLFDEPVEVHVLLWEYRDAINGARHVLRAFTAAPSAKAAEAHERLARSFRLVVPR